MRTDQFAGYRCVLGVLAIGAAAGAARAELVYGVTQTGFLASWDSATPGTVLMGSAIQGLQTNEDLVGLDLRPATGELYGLGSFSNIYRVDPMTGVATRVGTGFSPALSGTNFGFDFNPTVDRIREVSNANQNLRLNPVTGGIAMVDAALSYAAADPNFGADPNIVHAAYTNNFAGATSTTLYVVDSGLDILAIQNPPNNGVLNTVGALGTDVTELGGFDISGATGIAYMAIRDAQLARTTFWTVNLTTGQAMMVGEVGGGAIITAMTVIPAPGGLALAGLGAGLIARRRRR
ncbi:MAG: DUF4394 domain-containing protein [Phycisphaerales bacterium]|nr:DUF4394 domain-containing protein [Phycisphaerales bacterium]